MARVFTAASSQYLSGNIGTAFGTPLSCAYFLKITNLGASQMSFYLGNSSGTQGRRGNFQTGSNRMVSEVNDSGVAYTAAASANDSISVNTWVHVAHVFSANSLRAIFINASKVTDTTSLTLANHSVLEIGRNPAGGSLHDGKIAWWGLWRGALTDEQVAELSRGRSPKRVLPSSLVDFYHFAGSISGVGSVPLTNNNGATDDADFPRVYT